MRIQKNNIKIAKLIFLQIILQKKINNSINHQIKIANLRFHMKTNQNENILSIKIKRNLTPTR